MQIFNKFCSSNSYRSICQFFNLAKGIMYAHILTKDIKNSDLLNQCQQADKKKKIKIIPYPA
ncbi:MAG: hypothetical protein DA446_07105 [Bacteroidetes bacterium]|nr:MAG: hypothetical protein DA446_07105 [Bacteroidota bacterium]